MNHPTYSDAVQQAFNDWNDGSAYLDNGGNYRVRTRDYSGYLSPGGKIAPWNREVKRLFAGNGEFYRAAKQFKEAMMSQTAIEVATAEHEHCLHLHENEKPGDGKRYCCSCEHDERRTASESDPDPGEPRRAGAGHDFTDWSVFYTESTNPDHKFEPRCYIMAKSATYGECRVFDVPDPDETQRAAAADACRALNNFDTLVEALAQELEALRIWQHAAHPRSDLQEGFAISVDKIERALARAREQG